MDRLSISERSKLMSSIKGKNTKPEIAIRSGLHRLGLRFRSHAKELPGKPDIKLTRFRAVIFYNGCFWHGHDCKLAKMPQSNIEFWENKISLNKQRDLANIQKLKDDGWRVLIIWSCAHKSKGAHAMETLIQTVYDWIVSSDTYKEIRGA